MGFGLDSLTSALPFAKPLLEKASVLLPEAIDFSVREAIMPSGKAQKAHRFSAAAKLATAKKMMSGGKGTKKGAQPSLGGPTPGVPPSIALENLEVQTGEGLGTATPAMGGTESIPVTKEEKSLWDQLAQYMNQDIQTTMFDLIGGSAPSTEGGFLRRILRNATFSLTGFPMHEWDTNGGVKNKMWNTIEGQ